MIGDFEINDDDSKRRTTVIANEDCDLIVVERETIKQFLKVKFNMEEF